jgi:hypothetical protein
MPMGNFNRNYQTRLTKGLTSLQKDFRAGNITEEEFNVLVGFLMKVEMNRFVQNSIQHLHLDADNKKMTFIGYAGTRQFTAA